MRMEYACYPLVCSSLSATAATLVLADSAHIDGGGVRGLSTLLIMKSLMQKINAERLTNHQPAVKPCELFDLIGGTSTGG